MSELDASFCGEMKALNIDVKEIAVDSLFSMSYAELAQAKSLLESTLESLFDLLSNKYKFDMDLPLVINGYPRRDIDVVSIRLLRAKIIRLRNDHKQVLQQIDHHLSQKLARKEPIEDAGPINSQDLNGSKGFGAPFAVIKSVVDNSPSHQAGLESGDKIVKFDESIDATNHENLKALANRVKSRKGYSINVVVYRNDAYHTLLLTPNDTWGGNGVLGCHVVPI